MHKGTNILKWLAVPIVALGWFVFCYFRYLNFSQWFKGCLQHQSLFHCEHPFVSSPAPYVLNYTRFDWTQTHTFWDWYMVHIQMDGMGYIPNVLIMLGITGWFIWLLANNLPQPKSQTILSEKT